MTRVPAGETLFRLVVIVLGGALMVLAIWTVSQEGVAEGLRTDWTAFDNAASRLLGGEQIYRSCLARSDRLYLTRVDAQLEGDAFFPQIDENHWQQVAEKLPEKVDSYVYRFIILDRK